MQNHIQQIARVLWDLREERVEHSLTCEQGVVCGQLFCAGSGLTHGPDL